MTGIQNYFYKLLKVSGHILNGLIEKLYSEFQVFKNCIYVMNYIEY